MHLTRGNSSDYDGCKGLRGRIDPETKCLVGDRGCDADWLRNDLEADEIQPCIPGRRNRRREIDYDKDLCKTRHRIENAFARLKGWRHVALRLHRCPTIFLGVVTFAVIVSFWL